MCRACTVVGNVHDSKMPQWGAVWTLCTNEQGQDCPVVVALEGETCSHCGASISRRKSSSWSSCCRKTRVFFSLMLLWLCLGKALKGVLQGVKAEVVGAYWWQKWSSVSTISSGPWFMWLCLWGSVYHFPYRLTLYSTVPTALGVKLQLAGSSRNGLFLLWALFSGDLQGSLSPICLSTLVEASLQVQQLQGGQIECTRAQALTHSAWLHKACFSGKPA